MMIAKIVIARNLTIGTGRWRGSTPHTHTRGRREERVRREVTMSRRRLWFQREGWFWLGPGEADGV
jgi:hypothetical protein